MKCLAYIVVFLSAVLAGCTPVAEVVVSVSQCASLPAGGLASACCCTTGDKAYVFGGRDSLGCYSNSLWIYDPIADTWTDLGTTPLKPRVNATMTAMGGQLFVGLGYATEHAYRDTAYLRDWWTYSPGTDTWTRLRDYPNANTVAASSFAVDGHIYTLYGFGYSFTKDIYRYDVDTDTWTLVPLTSDRAWMNFGGRGALCQGRLYFGLGYRISNLTQWFEVDLPGDTWQRRSSLPGKGREFAACAANDEFVYIFGGRYFAGDMTGGEIFDTYLRYSPQDDRWTRCGTMPCGRRENLIAFSLNDHVFFGLGEDESGRISNAIYRIE